MFTKGKSGNEAGRPKRSADTATHELRQRMVWFLEDKFNAIVEDYEEADARERRLLYMQLLPYAMNKKDDIPFHKMSDADLKLMLERVREEYERLQNKKS